MTTRWNECPTCSDLAEAQTAQPADVTRTFGPGEWAVFTCAECGAAFTSPAPMPEPLETD